MNKPSRQVEWAVWGGLTLIILAICAAYVHSRLQPSSPLPVIGQIPDFRLTNQNDQAVTLADLRGKVWVANVIFIRCPSACKIMSGQFAQLQKQLPSGVQLVSLTSDPDFDTPAEFRKYGARFATDTNRWWFLTGNKPDLRTLEVRGFKFNVIDVKPEERTIPDDLFIHSTYFVVVDKKGQMRGWTDKSGAVHANFDSDEPESLAQIAPAVKQLLRESP